MNGRRNYFKLSIFNIIIIIAVYLAGCQNDNVTDPAAQSDEEYLKTSAINSAFSTNSDDDDNLFSNEVMDFDSQGPVFDNESVPTPIDSILKWGRRITNVNVSTNITSQGDSLKNVEVTRTISGNFIIVGYINGVSDTTVKPYIQEQKRFISFKRIDRRPHPRHNWRVYQYSAVDGETKTPQVGKENITMSRIEFYKNNNLILTLNGPDFTGNLFTSRFFGGNRIFEVNRGDQIRIQIYLTSNQNDADIVAYHWARNAFGFHRERFIMTSQTPNGSKFDRTYEKTFTIHNHHDRGMHNAYISASTRSSLYDNSPSLFSSTYMGFAYSRP